MKNKFFKTCVVILLLSCFMLGGCVTSTPPDGGVDDSLMNTAGNADEILKTKDNITVYKDEKGDDNKGKGAPLFGDAIVFVDPGSDGIFNDHYTGSDMKFVDLVRRQIDYLAKILTQSISDFYINTDPLHTNKNYYSSISFAGVEGKVDMFPDEGVTDTLTSLNMLDFKTLATLAGIYNSDTLPKVGYKENSEDETTLEEDYFNFRMAVFGGYERVVQPSGDTSFTGATGYKNDAWELLDNYGLRSADDEIPNIISNLEMELKIRIASAVSGSEVPNGYTATATRQKEAYEGLTQKIDHLGFTTTDKLNIINSVLENVIGKTKVDLDNSYRNTLGYTDESFIISKVDFDSKLNERDYKSYTIVIKEMVNKATSATYEKVTSDGLVNEKVFIEFPRISLMLVDIDYIMDNEPISEDSEEVDTGDGTTVEIPDVDPSEFENQKTTLDEKFDKYMKIVGVMLMPNAVTGDRTMARKENGEWVYKSDGKTVATKTFEVNGFLVPGGDFSLIAEDGKSAQIQTTMKVHTKNKEMVGKSDVMNVGSVKPEAGDENFSYSVELLDGQKTQTLEENETIKSTDNVEGTLESFRMGGYDGVKLVLDELSSTGRFMYNGVQVSVAKGVRSENGKYTTFTISTDLYKYIGIDDVNGEEVAEEDRTTFAGYILNLANFAGNNYVQVDFTILAVNDDPQNRDLNLNILGFSVEGN